MLLATALIVRTVHHADVIAIEGDSPPAATRAPIGLKLEEN